MPPDNSFGDNSSGSVKYVSTLSLSELSMSNLRAQRNILLAETDWSQGADVPSTIKAKYNTYRQQLRDLPASSSPVWNNDTGTLSNVTWPTKPS